MKRTCSILSDAVGGYPGAAKLHGREGKRWKEMAGKKGGREGMDVTWRHCILTVFGTD